MTLSRPYWPASAAVSPGVCLAASIFALASPSAAAAQKPDKPCNGKKCADTAPPSVVIQSPAPGATVSGDRDDRRNGL